MKKEIKGERQEKRDKKKERMTICLSILLVTYDFLLLSFIHYKKIPKNDLCMLKVPQYSSQDNAKFFSFLKKKKSIENCLYI
jgi:hypothetical protein